MSDFDSLLLEKYKGVKGWLLLLCIALTIIGPIRIVIYIVTYYNESYQFFDQFPGLEITIYVDGILSIVITVLSIRAGLALWYIKPRAVRIAKNFLLIYLGYSIIVSVLPFMAGLPPETNDAMIFEAAKGVIQSLFFFLIWYWYLSLSKRVKATYSIYSITDDSSPTKAESEKIDGN